MSPPPAPTAPAASPARADPATGLGLFVLWPRARPWQARVLADLARDFTVVDLTEVHWRPEETARNYRRFYSDIPIRGAAHQHNKGTGPLLAIVVRDPAPALGLRDTTRGPRRVNVRMLAAKQRHRQWAPALGVHCTENAWETRRDLALLLDQDVASLLARPAWSGPPAHRRADLVGAQGWSSWAAVARVLDRTAAHVWLDGPGPPTVLTDRYPDLPVLLGATHRHARLAPEGGAHRLRVAERDDDLVVRFVGDGFLDAGWARALLARRQRGPDGRWRPAPEDALALALYRAALHRWPLAPETRARLARAAGHDPGALSGPGATAHLAAWLDGQGFGRPRPADLRVAFDHGHPLAPPVPAPALAGASDALRALGHGARWRLQGPATAGWLAARDAVLTALPQLRRLRRGPGDAPPATFVRAPS